MSDHQDVTPAFGEKTIRVQVKLFTEGIAERGKIRPKHALRSGYVTLIKNESHGIDTPKRIFFKSIAELPGILESEFVFVD